MSMTPIGGPLSMRPCAAILPADRPNFPAPGRAPPRGCSFKGAPPREAAGRRLLERFSAARQAWVGHEILVGIERLFAGSRLDTRGRAVGQERPALLVVLELGDHGLIHDLLVHGGG